MGQGRGLDVWADLRAGSPLGSDESAEQDGGIVGMALGFMAEERRRSSDRPLRQAAGFPSARMRTVQLLTRPMLQVLNAIADGDFYLLSIAIDEGLRGQGVGFALMDAIEDRARASGSTRLTLDVAAKIEGARRLYEHREMTVESRWPKRLPLRGLKLFRMTKSLEAPTDLERPKASWGSEQNLVLELSLRAKHATDSPI
jgi:ribosomal protein S18 acetylase RimI-like enzyme